MQDHKKPNDQFDLWWPNLCVISECGCPMPVMVSAARHANAAIKKAIENNR